MKNEELAKSLDIKRQEEEKFEELIQMKRSRGTSFDYLKEQRKIKKSTVPLRHSIDMAGIIPKRGKFDYSTKRLCMEKLKNFDLSIKQKEERIKLQSDTNQVESQETFDTSQIKTPQGQIEDYYVKSIQAKLKLINDIGGI